MASTDARADLERFDALLVRIETLNALRLTRRPTRIQELHQAKEKLKMAAADFEGALSRVEADQAAESEQDVMIHTHVGELRQMIASLQGQVVTPQMTQRLNAIADNIEADLAAGAGDTSEPTPPPAP